MLLFCRLALVISVIVPCIGIAGGVMNKFLSSFKQRQLEATARGSTLAEEVISSVRTAHAFGTQDRLADMYEVYNQETLKLGLSSAKANGIGLAFFFFSTSCSAGYVEHYTQLVAEKRGTILKKRFC